MEDTSSEEDEKEKEVKELYFVTTLIIILLDIITIILVLIIVPIVFIEVIDVIVIIRWKSLTPMTSEGEKERKNKRRQYCSRTHNTIHGRSLTTCDILSVRTASQHT